MNPHLSDPYSKELFKGAWLSGAAAVACSTRAHLQRRRLALKGKNVARQLEVQDLGEEVEVGFFQFSSVNFVKIEQICEQLLF